MPDDGLELIKLRNNFYRDNYRRLVVILFLMIIINIALVGTIVYLLTHKPAPEYFATSADGRITPLSPLDQPVVTPAEVLQWANEAVIKVYSYNFVNYRQALQEAAQYFTPEGWKDFQTALQSSRVLETVLAKKFVVSAVATGAPTVTDQGLLNGRYAWRIRIPLLVTYQSSGGEQIQQPVTATILIVRVSNLETPKGIAIAQFYASERPLTEGK